MPGANRPQRLAAAVAGLLAGCSTSVVMQPNDPTFIRARERLARTEVVVQAIPAESEERVRFMQAEGLYRYRFEFPTRGLKSHLAQAAAVIIELPALQAFAGSFDLMELRLRSYDAAVQLWEALLAERPRTLLRPLTLYRLGWAYRSAGVAGLPRQSGAEAFDVLIHDYPGSPFADLARAAKNVPLKSKATATGLSLLPGLGHIYAGEYLSGGVRVAVALAAAAMIAVTVAVGYRRRAELSWGSDWPLVATGLGGVFILSIDYTTAYQDALRAVVQFNERAEQGFENAHPQAP